MEPFKTKANKCPFCGEKLDLASDLVPQDSRPPTAGDVCVCHYCAEVMEFCADGTLIQAKLSTLMQLTKTEHQAIDKVIATTRGKKGAA